MSNEPIALMFLANGQIMPYKIRKKRKYFTILDKKGVKGIYTINNKYRWSWGKTPVYLYAQQETNPIDPIIIDELNKFKKRNKLTEIKRKDVRHASRLRNLITQNKASDSIDLVKAESERKDKELQGNIAGVKDSIDKRIETLKTQHGKDIDISDGQKSTILLEHLKEVKNIDDKQFVEFSNKVDSNVLDYDDLIEELRNLNVVTISEPLDENVEDFIQDLGSQNGAELAGFVDDLRLNKKGLKDMTASPVKAFIPASVLFVIIIGALIGIPIIVSQLPLIDNFLKGKAAEGGQSGNPFENFLGMGGYIFELANNIPNFILGLF